MLMGSPINTMLALIHWEKLYVSVQCIGINNLFQVANEDQSSLKVMDISQLLADCEFY